MTADKATEAIQSHMQRFAVIIPGPFTADDLRALADERMAYGRAEVAGVTDNARERYDARRLASWASCCADAMTKEGVTSTHHFGPFSSVAYPQGVMVRVKAGAVRRSSRLGQGAPDVVKKAYAVKVLSATAGHCDPGSRHPVIHPQIEWTGAGGYYISTDPNNIEPIDPIDGSTSVTQPQA